VLAGEIAKRAPPSLQTLMLAAHWWWHGEDFSWMPGACDALPTTVQTLGIAHRERARSFELLRRDGVFDAARLFARELLPGRELGGATPALAALSKRLRSVEIVLPKTELHNSYRAKLEKGVRALVPKAEVRSLVV
jgi:hypothetical protein